MRTIFTGISILILTSVGLNRLAAQSVAQPTGTSYATVSQCGGTYYDNNPSGNYANNCNSLQVICPSTAGQYIRLNFSSFNTESGYDFLIIHDGNALVNPGAALIGSYSGTSGPGTVTSSDPSGCLSMVFYSDGGTRKAGWDAAISCVSSPGTSPSSNMQNCGVNSGQTICSNSVLNGNSSGAGVQELLSAWDGCLGGEHQSSWYYFSPSASGSVGFTITPSNSSDDYDFAIWGPYSDIACPDLTANNPVRCSYAGGGGPTGLSSSAGTQTSEGSGGDGFVGLLNVNSGDVYVMVIDNYSVSNSPFSLSWSLTGGASLDCTLLPVELLSFTGNSSNNGNLIKWETATETNNDYFLIQRSENGRDFENIGKVDGQGNSVVAHQYEFLDQHPLPGINYYRLEQFDYDNSSTSSNIIALKSNIIESVTLYPNPSNGDFQLNFQSAETEKMNLIVRDISGRLVYESNITAQSGFNRTNLNLAGTPEGIYFITLQNISGNILVRERFIIGD